MQQEIENNSNNVTFYDEIWSNQWQDMERFNPTARHLEVMINALISAKKDIASILDVGCGMGVNIKSLKKTFPNKKLAGTDLSPNIMEIAHRYLEKDKNIELYPLDIAKNYLPKKFDLILCNQVLEHIEDDVAAISNMIKMTNRYLLITVPSGRYNSTSRLVGHVRHYDKKDLLQKIEANNLNVIFCREWGFPFHSIYKTLLGLMPETAQSKIGLGTYNIFQKMISHFLYLLFFCNIFNRGENIVVLAEIKSRG